jgi:hypothetical protein
VSAIVYTTDLPKDECLHRLQKYVGRRGWQRWADGTIVVEIRNDSFRLFAWGPANARNSFALFFYGNLQSEAAGTSIRGHFRFHPMVRGFMVLWFGGLMAGCALILFTPESMWSGRPAPSALWVLAPLAMMFLGCGFLRFGQWLARSQNDSIRNFLIGEFEARRHVGVESSSKSLLAKAAAPGS